MLTECKNICSSDMIQSDYYVLIAKNYYVLYLHCYTVELLTSARNFI